MNKEYGEIQNSLFANEFKNFCRKRFSGNLKELERLRRVYLLAAFTLILLLGLLFFFEFYCFDLNENFKANITGIVIFDIIAIFSSVWIIISVAKLYKTEAKKQILVKLLSFMGDFKRTQGTDETYTKKLKIFPPFEKYSVDDRIKGSYGLLKIDIAEIRLSSKENPNLFSGILIKIPYIKKFEKETLIRRKSNCGNIGGFKPVHFDYPRFEEFYEVLSTDETEARMLINSGFIRRITQYAKYGIGENVLVSFEQNNINIVLVSNKDWFTISFFKSAYDMGNYRIIILEIIAIMKIIDSLKTEKSIGL